MTGTSQQTFDDGGRIENATNWRQRRQGWDQQWRSPPTVDLQQLPPTSNNLAGTSYNWMMTGQRWLNPQEGSEEVGEVVVGAGEGGSGCSDVGNVLCCGGSGGYSVWVGDAGYVPANWEDIGQIPPKSVPQVDKAKAE